MVQRGEVFWIDLGEPRGSEPAHRRPVVVVSADRFNRTRLSTVLVAVITSNARLAAQPGNVFVPSGVAGLTRDSVVNVTQIVTVDRARLADTPTGILPWHLLDEVSSGLRLSFDV